MSWDYMDQKGKHEKIIEDDEDMNKAIIEIDRENAWISVVVAETKGVDPYAIGAVGREIENSGFSIIMISSDQEPAMHKLLEAIQHEGSEEIDIEKDVERIPESTQWQNLKPVDKEKDSSSQCRDK